MLPSYPLVSVILTTRDRFRLLSIALACYSHQTYRERELIVVDDGDRFPADYDADAVVVPLRAGGGTRIKILEAMSFMRPVVSTSIGAEGLAVSHVKEVLVADDPDTFARTCAALMEDSRIGTNLAAHAVHLLNREHTIDVLTKTLQVADARVAFGAALTEV